MRTTKMVIIEEDNRCGECGELWDSEYHMSDECVNVDEDMELKADLYRKYGS